MTTKPNLVSFASDNHSGIHPLLLESLVAANVGSSASYEQDPWSQKLKAQVKNMFDGATGFLVFNGTAANVLCLQAALRPFEGVLCSDVSHLHVDECGAPEKIAGCKLYPIPSRHGKMDINALKDFSFRAGDQHHTQVKMVSITQPTEYGTLYSFEEIEDIKNFCKAKGLLLHIDGARLGNAAAAMNCSFSELTQGVDLLSLGGAKTGLLGGELVVIKNSDFIEDFRFLRKQSLQLPSKTRFFAAPFLTYLEGDFWLKIASHENQMASYLREKLEAHTPLEMTQPTQANAVFCKMPQQIVKPLRKKYFFYVWDEKTFEVRLMTSFDTQKEDIDDFVQQVQIQCQKENL